MARSSFDLLQEHVFNLMRCTLHVIAAVPQTIVNLLEILLILLEVQILLHQSPLIYASNQRVQIQRCRRNSIKGLKMKFFVIGHFSEK